MSSLLATDYYRSVQDYLAAERVSELKHEYLAGVIYAMVGASVRHNLIAGNIYGEFLQLMRGKPCEVYSSDVKVRVRGDAAEFYYYPDVTVDCSSPPEDSYYAEEPLVIFEVLSKETERIDRGEKLQNYQTLPSLHAYVLVDQTRIAVAVYRRTGETWKTEFLSLREEVIRLPEIDSQLPLAAIYARTDLLA